MGKDKVVETTKNALTDYEKASLYIASVATFVEVGSRADLTKEEVFALGRKLFNEALGKIE